MKTLTKKPRKSHIGQIREANRKGLEQVCHLLQCTEQEYCEYMFDQYCYFIEARYAGFPEVIEKAMLYSTLFCGMFINEAFKRDEAEFLPYALEVTEEIMVINTDGELEVIFTVPLGGEYLVSEWLHIHNYKRLLKDDNFIDQADHISQLKNII